VDREKIIEDYAVSEHFGLSDIGRRQIDEASKGHLDSSHWGSAPPAAMRNTLEFIDKQFGSVEAYLEAIGFSARMQARLEQHLCVEGSVVQQSSL
jgi:protein tyrosine/serine phosphatase